MPFQRVGDLNLFYRIHDPRNLDGPAVVLLHGLGSCADDWPLQIPALGPRYRLLMVDLRGHGRSDAKPGWPRVSDMAGDVVGLLRSLGEPAAHLVGLSLGGAVALQMALDWQDQVRSMTLVNAFARLQPGVRRTVRGAVRLALLLCGRMDALGRWVARGLFPESEQAELRRVAANRIANNSRSAYLQAVVAAMRFDVRPRLSQVGVPTLVIAGERDDTVPMVAKLSLAGGMPNARIECFPTSGHATPYDAPTAFNRALLDFLSRVDSPRRTSSNASLARG